MAGSFKKKLLELYHDETGRFGKKRSSREYEKMIRYGALGQLAENHFLFIYRDLFRSSGYYGAVIFFNIPDELGNPVRVTCIEQDGVEQRRDIYIKAALYFIKEGCKNTMDLSGSAEKVFELAKEKIDSYLDRQTPQGDRFKDFVYDLANRKIKYKEIDTRKVTAVFKDHTLAENLAKLQSKNMPKHVDEIESRTKALPGLNLKIEIQDLTGGKTIYFQPLIIPLKRDGTCGKPRRLEGPATEAYEFDFETVPRVLEDFFKLFILDADQKANQTAKVKMVNQLYFRRIAAEIFASSLASELLFCQPDRTAKEYKALKSFKFKKLAVRFAPSLKQDSRLDIFLRFTNAGSQDNQDLNARDNYEIKIIGEQVYIFFVSAQSEYYLAVPEEPKHFLPFFNLLVSQREFYLSHFQQISSVLKSIESPFIAVERELLKKYKFNLLPTPILKIREGINEEMPGTPVGERLEIEFDYIEEIKKFVEKNPDKEVYSYDRDEEFESACFALLKSDNLLKQEIGRSEHTQSVYYYFSFRDCHYLEWLIQMGKKYLEKGFSIYSTKWEHYIGNTGSKIQVHVSSGIDWLEFRPLVYYESENRSHKIASIDFEQNTVIDEQGMLHLVTKAEIDKLAHIYKYKEKYGTVFRIPSKNHILIQELYDKRMEEIPGLEEVLKTGEKLENFKEIPGYEISPKFRGQLRDYQKAGFQWLYLLREYDFSGCLADDMGLGKTVQALVLLQSLKDRQKLKTSLLVVPVSAIPNWESEIERFTPNLTFYRHQGMKRDKNSRQWGKKDLVITSYATMRNDIEIFEDFNFDYLILDESQNIKNFSAGVSKAARVLKGDHRLALSGTPIENHSLELWSLFDFLLPGFLGTSQWFKNQFTTPIERDKDQEKIELLKKMIYPFILRRKKKEVEQELPEKIEILSKLSMDEEQAALYAKTAAIYRKDLEDQLDDNSVPQADVKIFEKMLRLRQICLFPGLVDEKYTTIPSAKFDYLVELLEEIISEDHKVLVFSQFVQVLTIIRKYLEKEAIDYCYIDGSASVDKREKEIGKFQQEEETKIFLLSLKAGGVSLNLTAADYVIIFDPWWNPAVEAQAIDRSHRIGQTKKVIVYKMVLEHSIEEKMLKLQEQKKALLEDLITSDSGIFKDLSKADLLELFTW